MKYRHYLIVVLGLALLTITPYIHGVVAQTQTDWSSPFRLSTNGRKASEAYVVSDQYGYVHIFWTEELADERSIIQYARYEGGTWPLPIDIHVTQPFKTIGNLSPVVDQEGVLHLAWSEGDSGPAYYVSAPAHDATSAQKWEQPRLLKVPANRIKLQVDSKGILHVLYVKFLGGEPGVYYMRSEDQGVNWSTPLWLDPDILPDYGPRALNFAIDASDGLHAVWYYVPREDLGGDWVRYIHSLDGGDTWAQPFTIDRIDENALDSDEKLSAASPVMAVEGQNVHVIWAGGKLHYRHHRFSTDQGVTWSADRRIFGELNGQAFDGLTVDGDGRLHFFGQIRFPMGIYHAIWDEDQWTTPSLIYLIRYNPTDSPEGRIGAHNTHPVIRAGNELILTLTDPPSEPEFRLFVMEHTLDDVSPITAMPVPTSTPVPTPNASPTPFPTESAIVPSFERMPAPVSVPTSGSALSYGIISVLFLFLPPIVIKLLKLRH